MNPNDPIRLVCPECGRTQDVDPMTYECSLSGHPLTCNGGNPDISTHHDHMVVMQPAALVYNSRFSCPRCGYPIYCGCPTCLPNIPDGYKPQKNHIDPHNLICADCGLTMSEDAWMDEEIRQADTNVKHRSDQK